MDDTLLSMYLEIGEFHKIHQLLAHQPFQNLSQTSKEALVIATNVVEGSVKADILYHKFNLDNKQLRAQLLTNRGELKDALDSLEDHKGYLAAEILLGLGRFEEARLAIQDLELNGQWLYFMGRCYGQSQNHTEAIQCLKEAVAKYTEVHKRLHANLARANLANSLNSLNRYNEAEKEFATVVQQLKGDDLENFPQLSLRILLNAGFFYQERGQYFKALKNLFKAYRLAQKFPASNEFIRASLLLSYTCIELGHYRRALHWLQTIEPLKRNHQLDHWRYQALAQSRLGHPQKALENLQQALQLDLDGHDFARKYLPIDAFEIYYCAGQEEKAQLFLHRSQQESYRQGDLNARFYAHNRQLLLSKGQHSSEFEFETSMAYHIENNSPQEVVNTLLAEAMSLVQNSLWTAALDTLKQNYRPGGALKMAWQALLRGICHLQNQDRKAHTFLNQAYKLFATRDHLELTALSLELALISQSDTHLFHQSWPLYEELKTHLTATHQQRLLQLKERFVPHQIQRLCKVERQHIVDIDTLSAKKIQLETPLVIFLHSETIYWSGQIFFGLDRHPVLKRLLLHLARHSHTPQSKEQLNKVVLKKESYNPEIDDNLIYVSVNRLKKTFNNRDLIHSAAGTYQLNEGPHIAIIDEKKLDAQLLDLCDLVLIQICHRPGISSKRLLETLACQAEELQLVLHELLRRKLITSDHNSHFSMVYR